MTSRIAVVASAFVLPASLSAQMPPLADTGSLVLIISRDQGESLKADTAIRVAGARVTVKSGALVGTADDSGSVDTVHVNMQLERKVVVWSSPGCKQRR